MKISRWRGGWRISYRCYEIVGELNLGLIEKITSPALEVKRNECSGVGHFVRHANFKLKFWCTDSIEGVAWLVIGSDAYKLEDLSYSVRDNYFISTLTIKSAAKTRIYKVLQPWIRMPWVLIDVLTYDNWDLQGDSFPAYLMDMVSSPSNSFKDQGQPK